MMGLKLQLELVSSALEVHPFSRSTGKDQRYDCAVSVDDLGVQFWREHSVPVRKFLLLTNHGYKVYILLFKRSDVYFI